MKLNSINNCNSKMQNFRGSLAEKTVKFASKHPEAIAALAGSSVIMQKIVMSGSEAVIGPAMDMGIGKIITDVTKEKDGRTMESSKLQAIRTFSQSVGGTIVGVVIRGLCIAGATALCMGAGGKVGQKLASKISDGSTNKFLQKENAVAWGKSIGGAVAIGVMMFTNFLIDAPFINVINKKVADFCNKGKNPENKTEQKTNQEVKEAK